ncbi:MAG: hypothetical protein KC503_11860 [Myxococcales bacterium]|nr:hypothetical protein [Myxococcales bacterium]
MSHSPKKITAQDIELPQNSLWRKLPLIGVALAVIGLGASAGIAWKGGKLHPQFYFSYLVAYAYWLSLALGGLFFVIVQFAARAGWSVVVRRIAEHAMLALPAFAVLFIPIALGLHDLYHWSHAEAVAKDLVLQDKAAYLNTTGFYTRAGAYFILWFVLAWYFWKKSTAQDESKEAAATKRMQIVAGPSIVIFALTLTFAAFDWIMSLDPHWYSTIFGPYYFAGTTLAIFSFISLMGVLLQRSGVLKDVITSEHYHDLGKLIFAFTVFWAYIAFSQYMLIWYGNIPEETVWFKHRGGAWLGMSIFQGVGHFAVPFFFMINRTIKRFKPTLIIGALMVLTVHYFDMYWLIMPTYHHHGPHFTIVDLTTFVGVGGVFLAVFGYGLARHKLIPAGDPRLKESLAFKNI